MRSRAVDAAQSECDVAREGELTATVLDEQESVLYDVHARNGAVVANVVLDGAGDVLSVSCANASAP